jgi:hypothetical protein
MQFAFVKRVLAIGAFYENACRVYGTLFVVVGRIDLRFVSFEPGHFGKG